MTLMFSVYNTFDSNICSLMSYSVISDHESEDYNLCPPDPVFTVEGEYHPLKLWAVISVFPYSFLSFIHKLLDCLVTMIEGSENRL